MANNAKGQFIVPSFQQGWGGSFYGAQYVSGFSYDLSDEIFYIIYPQQQFDVYLQANTTLAQALSVANRQLPGKYQNPNIPDPDNIYTQLIENILPQCVLAENGSPLLAENGNYLVLT